MHFCKMWQSAYNLPSFKSESNIFLLSPEAKESLLYLKRWSLSAACSKISLYSSLNLSTIQLTIKLILMIHAIIIDDEQPAREYLSLLISRYFSDTLTVDRNCASLGEGIEAIQMHKPDLVFLDIEMPGENGLQLFNHFEEVDFSVIFTTAYREYAIDAVKLSAVDYLLKPISPQDLQSAITLYVKKQLKRLTQTTLSEILNKLNSSNGAGEKIAFPTMTGFGMIKVDTIVYCEADQNYTNVFCIDGERLVVSRSLMKVEEMLLPYPFFRIHKSHLINLKYVKSFNRQDGARVTLDNGVTLSVAFRRVDAFVQILTRRKK